MAEGPLQPPDPRSGLIVDGFGARWTIYAGTDREWPIADRATNSPPGVPANPQEEV